MREALSGTSSRCFTVSPALISIFWGGFWLVLVVFFVCLVCWLCWFVFVFLFVSPPRVRSFELCANSMQSCTTVGAVMARTAWEKKKNRS